MNLSLEQIFAQRRSLRSFSDRAVDRDTIRRLFEAARWASSARNEQPWHYVVLDDPASEIRLRVLASMEPHNCVWAEKAPVVLVSVAQLGFRGRDNQNRHAYHDVGQANAHLALRAAELGLSTHIIGGFNAAAAGEALKLPPGFDVVALIAIGYPGLPDALPEHLRVREVAPRVRKEIEEFVYFRAWPVLGTDEDRDG